MPGTNWDRVRRENTRTADRRSRQEANTPHITFAAKYPGTCATCNTAINVGDRVASKIVNAKRAYHHERCNYPPAGSESVDTEALAEMLAGPIPDGRCHAVTKAGKPCAGGAKRGELYCGPHIDKLISDPKSTPTPVSKTASPSTAYDPYYDDPF